MSCDPLGVCRFDEVEGPMKRELREGMAALPSLAGLSLNVRPVVSTEDFCELDAAKVAELNAGGGCESITLEKFLIGQDIDSDNPTFCIQWPNGKGYNYYYGRALWGHVLTKLSAHLPVKDPQSGRVIEPYDIDRLRARFEESRQDQEYGGGVVFFEGRDLLRRKVREELTDAMILYYKGPQGEERLVREEWPDSEIWYYEGPKGREHLIRQDWPDGEIRYYEGPQYNEHLVREYLLDSAIRYYEGPKDEEHVVRIAWDDREIWYYKGPAGAERVVRKELPGDVEYYKGDNGKEHMVRVERADGTVVRSEGQMGTTSDPKKKRKTTAVNPSMWGGGVALTCEHTQDSKDGHARLL